jgi:hypothetical protein
MEQQASKTTKVFGPHSPGVARIESLCRPGSVPSYVSGFGGTLAITSPVPYSSTPHPGSGCQQPGPPVRRRWIVRPSAAGKRTTAGLSGLLYPLAAHHRRGPADSSCGTGGPKPRWHAATHTAAASQGQGRRQPGLGPLSEGPPSQCRRAGQPEPTCQAAPTEGGPPGASDQPRRAGPAALRLGTTRIRAQFL